MTVDPQRFVVISGCSGGGKSTLLAELARRGWPVVEEPGRRIVGEELASRGRALPWVDMESFARRALELALRDRDVVGDDRWVFFDRGVIDAATALQHVTGDPVWESVARAHRYHRNVFMTPPWPEIHAVDAERRNSWQDAVEEYERLLDAYGALDYDILLLPRADVVSRADFVLRALGSPA